MEEKLGKPGEGPDLEVGDEVRGERRRGLNAKRAVRILGIAAAVLMLFVVALMLGACGKPAQDPCQVNPTRTASDGSWVEADGEQLDNDPCDADDLEEDDGFKKKRPSKKKR